MEILFGDVLLRLKQVLGMHADKEVAEALGLTDRAFAARKLRDSFPKDKLFALVAHRPDLKIDAGYVLTGVRTQPAATPGAVEPAAVDGDSLARALNLLIGRAGQRGVKFDRRSIGTLGAELQGYLAKGYAVDETLIDLLLDAYVVGRSDRF